MENIHVIPTDKPSRLFKDDFGKYFISINVDQEQKHFKPQNIYITNDEEIKEGYHVFNTKSNHYGGVVNKNNLSDARLLSYIKKIILTTDQDLIADGVEQISEDTLLKIVEHINSGKNIKFFDKL
jgi:hypothetical protein